MVVYYRISDTGYKKEKPNYINNENCLRNFVHIFTPYTEIKIIADNVSDNTFQMISKYAIASNIERVSIGHGAGTFNVALNNALRHVDDTIVYFVENDYLHLLQSPQILQEGFLLPVQYVSLYDHPDKYIYGTNPLITEGGSEQTRVYLTKSCHWKLTNSTTMTFAARVKTLKEDEAILRKWTKTSHPHDFDMFLDLGTSKRRCIATPIPGFATHGESNWLSPLTEWSNIV